MLANIACGSLFVLGSCTDVLCILFGFGPSILYVLLDLALKMLSCSAPSFSISLQKMRLSQNTTRSDDPSIINFTIKMAQNLAISFFFLYLFFSI